MPKIVKIELNTEEAENFKLFRKYQDDFEKMLKAGIFNFKNGKAIIHRDSAGKIRKIEIMKVALTS